MIEEAVRTSLLLVLKAFLVSRQSSDTGMRPNWGQKLVNVLFKSMVVLESGGVFCLTLVLCSENVDYPPKKLESNQHQLIDAIELPGIVL